MAGSTTTRTIEVIFGGRDTTLTSTANSSLAAMNKFAGGVQSVGDRIGGFGETLLKTEAAILAVGVAFSVVALNKFAEFETSLVAVQRVLGDAGGDMDEISDTAIAMSNKFGISATDIAASFAEFKQAGFTLAESMALAETSIGLVKTSELGATDAAQLLKQALKGFGEEANQAGRFVDILNEVSNNYNTTSGQLARGMADLSPIAKQAGLSMEETASLLVPIIEIFGSGAEAANGLKSGLAKLKDDSPANQKAFEDIGLGADVLNRATTSSKDILELVSQRFLTLDNNQKAAFTTQVVGIEQAARMTVVLDGLGKQHDVLATAMGANGSAARELETAMATIGVAMQQFKSGFENILILSGKQFSVEALGVIKSATDIELALQRTIQTGGLDGLFNILKPQLNSLSDLLSSFADNIGVALENVDFSRFADSINNLISAISGDVSAFLGGKSITDADGLTLIIQGVVDTIASLTNVSAEMIKEFEPAFSLAGKLLQEFAASSDSTNEAFGKLLAQGVIIKEFGVVVGGAILLIKGGFESLNDILFPFIKLFSGTFEIASGLFDDLTGSSEKAAKAFSLPWQETQKSIENLTGMDEFWNGVDIDLSRLAGMETFNTLLEENIWADGENFLVDGMKDFESHIISLGGNASDASFGVKDLTASTSKLADAAAKTKKELFDQGIALGKVTADLTNAASESSKVLQSWAAMDLELAKLQDAAQKAGSSFPEVGKRFLQVGQDIASTAPNFRDVANQITGFSDKVIIMSRNLEGIAPASITAVASVVEMGNGIEKSVVALRGANNETSKTAMGWAQLDIEAAKLSLEASKSGVAWEGVGTQFQVAGKAAEGVAVTFKSVQNDILGFVTSALDVAKSMENIPKGAIETVIKLSELGIKLNETKIRMQELENAGKQLNLGFATAKLQADTEVVKATLTSLASSFTSSGDTFSKLVATATNAAGGYNFNAQNAVDQEERRRQGLFELQKAMTQEQIKSIRIKNEKAQKGENTVTVKADGLAPHLEAIWFEVMSQIQVTASAEGAELLLGV